MLWPGNAVYQTPVTNHQENDDTDDTGCTDEHLCFDQVMQSTRHLYQVTTEDWWHWRHRQNWRTKGNHKTCGLGPGMQSTRHLSQITTENDNTEDTGRTDELRKGNPKTHRLGPGIQSTRHLSQITTEEWWHSRHRQNWWTHVLWLGMKSTRHLSQITTEEPWHWRHSQNWRTKKGQP